MNRLVLFKLTMPNRGSWNGGWSGEDRFYGKIERLSEKVIAKICGQDEQANYYYSWPDGWGANVECRVIDGKESRKLRKTMDEGFCGYGWMISSIKRHGEIRA